MFDFNQFKTDIFSEQSLSGKTYKLYAEEIEEYLLEFNSFPNELFQIYLEMLNSPKLIQTHGIYQFFNKLYFDFEKLTELQKHQLRNVIEQSFHSPLENNLELWLSEIIQHKYEA